MDPHTLRVAREDVSKTFAEQVCLLAERHRDLRNIFIRTLAKCGSIATEVAPPCLAALAVLAQASDDSTAELYQAVANLNCEGLDKVLANFVVDLAAAA
ncbi:hypothetical protein AK812_SmicGene45030, partial [Symbiodinium microadriaticum]